MIKTKYLIPLGMAAAISIGAVTVSSAAQNNSGQMKPATTAQKSSPKATRHKRAHRRRHSRRMRNHAKRVPKANSLKKLSW
ncbi:MAG TPA: hypothetical protein VK208_23600 [Pyrinomonadaceae bacterium]|nr:hypothetical protein [Pyrinomonadaceae bacterium]